MLTGNSILIALGPLVVPSALGSADGVGALLGGLGLQVVLALVALVGPLSFDTLPRVMGISLGLGAQFAAIYLGFLARNFAGIALGPDEVQRLSMACSSVLPCWRA